MIQWLYRLADPVRSRARRKTWPADQALGRDGEDAAHRYLRSQGFTIIARNHRTRGGSAEVDLIAWEGDTLVFVEVKSRATADYGPPDRAIGVEKRRKIIFGALDYLRRMPNRAERIRFDIVNVVFQPPPAITHLRDAFRPE